MFSMPPSTINLNETKKAFKHVASLWFPPAPRPLPPLVIAFPCAVFPIQYYFPDLDHSGQEGRLLFALCLFCLRFLRSSGNQEATILQALFGS